MKKLIKPDKLNRGDMIAAVSLSWGGAGDDNIRWRYEQGVQRLEEVFGLRVLEMEHTLAGSEYIYKHPEKRAQDLMEAFRNPEVKAIVACIGGNDSIRMLPYIDFDAIHNNPKLFCGFSDTTVSHFMCMKAGISSVYGPAILTDFAENIQMFGYTESWIRKTWFQAETIGNILPAVEWTSEFLPWDEKNKGTARMMKQNSGHEFVQGSGKSRGRLIGGCIEVMDTMKGTALFPELEEFDNAILFMETCEYMSSPELYEDWIRWFATTGIMNRINGILLGKPIDEKYKEEYKDCLIKVLKECGREDMSVAANMNFGHTSPMICLPYGAMAEIDCESREVRILESAVK